MLTRYETYYAMKVTVISYESLDYDSRGDFYIFQNQESKLPI